jgi:hypothetical protein
MKHADAMSASSGALNDFTPAPPQVNIFPPE